jgi:hypothetical protein
MGNTLEIQFSLDAGSKGQSASTNDIAAATTVKRLSILKSYRILRIRCHCPLFQAIRYALWLSRPMSTAVISHENNCSTDF